MKEQLEDEIYEELIVHQVQKRFEETNVMDQEVESSHDSEFLDAKQIKGEYLWNDGNEEIDTGNKQVTSDRVILN